MKGVKRSGSTKLDSMEKAADTYQRQKQKHYDNGEYYCIAAKQATPLSLKISPPAYLVRGKELGRGGGMS